ncbi:hypothetical protein CDO87_02875 [Sagittula sp. P11]|uniref:calcium-binding protein n=1 Tax=Sagittula sp. P11 TaxID=2009329 RepID=UPI000C2D22DD|nr:calcium-binding protein [Sagittula sp. P11]AUC52192.1 hypothetical protein CDO87_02875 [Sagittula sp. P11]
MAYTTPPAPIDFQTMLEAGTTFDTVNRIGDDVSQVVAVNDNGDFVVAWSYIYSASDSDVVFREYNADGTPKGVAHTVADSADAETVTDIAYAPDGTVLVVYSSVTSGIENVFVQRVTTTGTRIGSAIQVESDAATVANKDQSNGKIAVFDNGDYAVVYQNAFSSTDKDVRLRLFNADDTAKAASQYVSTAASDQSDPDIAALASKDTGDGSFAFAVTLTQEEVDNTGSPNDVSLYRYDFSGTLLGNTTVNTVTNRSEGNSAVAVDADGRIYVAFGSTDGATGGQVFYRRFESNGTAVDASQVFVTSTQLPLPNTDIDVSDDGRFVLAFDGFTTQNVTVKMYAADGTADTTRGFDGTGSELGPSVAITTDGARTVVAALSDIGLTYHEARFSVYEGIGFQAGTGGSDTLVGTDLGIDQKDHLVGGSGDDTLTGGEGADTLDGGDDDDSVAGGAGDDLIIGGTGSDMIDGGADTDTLDYSALSGSVIVDANSGESQHSLGDLDNFTSIERFILTGSGDVFFGDSGDMFVSALGGNDHLTNGPGRDTLLGGSGNDTISFIYGDGQSGQSFDGGPDSDTLFFDGNLPYSSFNLRDDTVVGFEVITVDQNFGYPGAPTRISMTAAQISTINTVEVLKIGSDLVGLDLHIYMEDTTALDLSAVSISTMSDADGTGFSIFGDDDAESVTGTALGDNIRTQGGEDTVDALGGDDTIELGGGGSYSGGDDDDLFILLDGLPIGDGVGDIVNGGPGNDTLDMSGVTGTGMKVNRPGFSLDTNVSSLDDPAQSTEMIRVEHYIGTDQGDDFLMYAGDVSIEGRGGNDTILAGFNSQTISGGDGDDVIDSDFELVSSISDNLSGDAGNDTLRGSESGSDTIDGGADNDEIDGRGGEDRLIGGLGDDTIDGGAATDTAVYAGARGDFAVSVTRDGTVFVEDLNPDDGDEGRDVLQRVERLEFADGIVNVSTLASGAFGETGTVVLTHQKTTLTLQRTYIDPVVIAFVASDTGAHEVNARIQQVSGNTLRMFVQEPDYLDGIHPTGETVHYMVVEAGSWILPDGTLIEAGTLTSGTLAEAGFDQVAFDSEFDSAPVVISQVQTTNGPAFVTTRQNGTSAEGFGVSMQEEEAATDGVHNAEKIGWIAIEGGSGSVAGFAWEAGQVSNVQASNTAAQLSFAAGGVVAGLSSYGGSDPAWAGGTGLNGTTFNVRVEEDKSADGETAHGPETVDYFAFSGSQTLAAAPRQEILETGSATLTHQQTTLTLGRTYDNPVVLAYVETDNGLQEVNARITQVTGNSVTLRVQEPDYLDGLHPVGERVHYMVVEAGTWVLPDGTVIEAGTLNTANLTADGFEQVSFAADFDAAPVVLSQVQGTNGPSFVTTRQQGSTVDGFEVAMQEEEASTDGVHNAETIGWVAIEAGTGQFGGFSWEAGRLSGVQGSVTAAPLSLAADGVLAGLSTYGGSDPAWAGGPGLDGTIFNVRVEEDKSLDSETAHGNETVDYFAFAGSGIVSAYDYDLFV